MSYSKSVRKLSVWVHTCVIHEYVHVDVPGNAYRWIPKAVIQNIKTTHSNVLFVFG